ncbi:Ig-like domain-containing protein [Luteolibacter sp. Populi]|uniref:Ig-like domain-containing protein n=1 Tax=Luteolibacter sp. Populi TaxID=3230487 RepID=UPI0034666FE9
MADEVVRIMAANITSGNNQSYDPGHGNRIFRGLDPDIALVQEMNVTLNGSKNSSTTYRSWVDGNFGSSFHYHVEIGKSIPNGIVSRYPFLAAGVWQDDEMPDREFVWARIDLPGDMNLLAISVHLSSGGGSGTRNTQAGALRALIQANKQVTDHVVIGGDFNTDTRTESCLSTLSTVVVTASPWPVDQRGDGDTNAARAKPYDWVAPGSSLAALSTPLVVGSNSFTNGLVFDSRDYEPLSAVFPVELPDSGVTGMQHMAVMRAFLIPTNEPPVVAQGTSIAVTLSRNNTPTAFSRSLNATDVDGDPLTWLIMTAAAHGTAGIAAPATGGTVNLSYQPVSNYTGTDSFVVRVADGQGGADTITVNLTIQEPPNNAPVITEGTSVAVAFSKNNKPTAFSQSLSATDANGDSLSWSISSAAAHGTAGIVAPAAGGSVALSYSPAAGYTGPDAFTVQVADARGGFDTITVNLTVEPVAAIDGWTYEHFSGSGPLTAANEETLWGDNADPDSDGYTNLEEFAHGLDPLAIDAAPNLMSVAVVGDGDGPGIVLTYKIRVDDLGQPALSYAVQAGNAGMSAWSDLQEADFDVIGDTDLGEAFVARSIQVKAPEGHAAQYFRLVFTRPVPGP